MVKSFLILIILQIFVYASEQIILVVSDDYNSKKAALSCFEDGKKVFSNFDVNLGKKGLGLGLGEIELKSQSVKKYEGDKKAPLGIFKLSMVFGYNKQKDLKMPYLHVDKDTVCVDDSKHKNYNQIIQLPKDKPESFEYMKRDDKQYQIGVVVGHNKKQISQRGSCIFLHVQKHKDAGTAGCTSMSYEDLKKIVKWLDISKNPILIQVSKSELSQVKKLYPTLEI
jgi:L,D-peptidoglycan transpeptidase YkuD (ErfK/YbiS/YcfS/YnhG family)